MRIIQITDLHIAEVGYSTVLDIDVRGKFKSVLAEAKKQQPDLLVLSGDLCYDVGNKAVYQWIKHELDQSGLNYQVMPGNHDDSVMMAKVFKMPWQENTKESFSSIQYTVGKVLFLDSAKAALSEDQWSWLEQELRTEQSILLFMHHPPLLAQTPFMDNHYSFKEMDRFAEVLAQKNNISVFCGHYHTERFVQSNHFNVFITPSTMAQIDPEKPEYALGHLTPGFRVIDWDGEEVITYVRYLWSIEKG